MNIFWQRTTIDIAFYHVNFKCMLSLISLSLYLCEVFNAGCLLKCFCSVVHFPLLYLYNFFQFSKAGCDSKRAITPALSPVMAADA